jgi:outer membrane protein OmpA-like peptidoglycan-associated protein
LERQLVRAVVTGPVADALAGRRDGVRWQVTLPSDAQWAWAAKGGQYGRYPWGNDLDEQRANFLYASSYAARPVAVGSFPRDVSPFGVLDMVGNVREWTRTPSERAAGRLIRGAGFNSTAEQLEAHLANSGKMGVEARTESVGFRVAIAPLTPPVSRPAAESAAGSSAPESAACVPQTGGTFAPLYFPGDSIEITPASQQQLSAIVEALRRQKGVLTIEGHTPSGGAAAYNRTLSERRADIVSKYLMALGIDRSRLRAVAMGDTRPQCSNDTEAGRDANRRVEFRFATGNSAPTVRRIARSPGGIGLPPTQYTFTAEGATDPDGDSITYDWTISGSSGAPTLLKGPTVSQTLDAVGSYTVSLTVTDSGGASATATTSVSIGTITGVWTVACAGAPASFPTSFVATIRQDGNTLSGSLEAGGRAQSFPAPASLENTIRPGRQFGIGVEGAYNVWGDSDFYFNVTVDDNLETFTGTSQYCKSVRGVRRMPAAAK